MIRNGIDSESGVEGLLALSTFRTVPRYAQSSPALISLMGAHPLLQNFNECGWSLNLGDANGDSS
jgi:hypothetical protein